jgi:hypothetical protein
MQPILFLNPRGSYNLFSIMITSGRLLSLFCTSLWLYSTVATRFVLRIPRSDPSQATVLLENDAADNEDNSYYSDVSFEISDTSNYCVNLEGYDVVVSSVLNLPAKCSSSVPMNLTVPSTDRGCFNVAVASGSEAQAVISESGTCNTAIADGTRAQALITTVKSGNNAMAVGEDSKAKIVSSGTNNRCKAIGIRSESLISSSNSENKALSTGNDAQSKVLSGKFSTAIAGLNTTTDFGNIAVATGMYASAEAVNGTYNVASALAINTKATAGGSGGNYNNATAVAIGATSRAGNGDNNYAMANSLQATAIAGMSGNFNNATASGISSLAEAVNGDGNVVVSNGMKAHGSSRTGNYNQVICSGMFSYAAANDGDRNVVQVNGTASIGTVESSFDSKITCSGTQSTAKCFMSDRSIVIAAAEQNANSMVIDGSDNAATAQANNTIVYIVNSGSYNQASANSIDCAITISNETGGDVRQC